MSLKIFFIITILMILSKANAELLITKESLPYPEHSKVMVKMAPFNLEGNLLVTNPGDKVWLLQAWMQDEKNNKYPYVYPGLSRLESNSSRNLKVIIPRKNTESSELANMGWLILRFLPTEKKSIESKLVLPIEYRMKILNSDRYQVKTG
ncbi:fimbria/pilus periplasmic chaperone [Escherichia coli]|uniref:fimbria/pilus periplasmic chaperone n=1 Tax=Escherichia coli TaxID=562 RepID=UPI003892B921